MIFAVIFGLVSMVVLAMLFLGLVLHFNGKLNQIIGILESLELYDGDEV